MRKMSQHCNIQSSIFAIPTEKNENNHCASCDCDVEDATEEEGDERYLLLSLLPYVVFLFITITFSHSEPPVSDEAVSRKPYPHVRMFQYSTPLLSFLCSTCTLNITKF